MNYRFAKRASLLAQSDIRGVTKTINEIGGINLGQGLCPLPTDPRVRYAAMKAITEGYNIYSPMEGLLEARESVSEKLLRHNKFKADPETEILMTVGASGALACAIDVLLDPGDELILFEPYYGYHYNIAKLRGVNLKMVRTHSPTWEIDFDQLESSISDKTKAILVCTPSNPSGKVFTRAELERVAEISQRHDLLVITDEVYEYIVFDEAEHVSMASLPGMFERTITIGAATKTFFVTGWRIGWAAGPAPIIQKMANASDLNYICPPSPNQKGIADALRMPQSYFDDLTELFLTKRNLLVSALTDAGIQPSSPTGAYYIMADYRDHGWKSDEEARDALIHEIGVGCVTGNSFYGGSDPSGMLRFCFAIDDDSLAEACRRLRTLKTK